MSRKRPVTTWQRELYRDVYSWIREFNRSGNTTPFRRVLVNTHERQAIFGRALISYQNRRAKLTGWQNPLRAGQFGTAVLNRYPELFIPF